MDWSTVDWPSAVFLAFGTGFVLGLVNDIVRNALKGASRS